MTIQVATDSDKELMDALASSPELPSAGMAPDDDTFEESDDSSYNFRQIMDMVYQDKDLIFTIPSDQEKMFRIGVSIRKAKDTQKLKDANVVGSSEVLSFLSYGVKDDTGDVIEGIKKVRVKLGPKKSINILNIERPDDEL